MIVAYSQNRRSKETNASVAEIINGVSKEKLRAFVEMLSFPRHYLAEHKANVRARNLLIEHLREFGYTPVLQGNYDNIVATTDGSNKGPSLLLGAHYDSVPGTPGADDNASAVAVCLECARLVKEHDIGSVMIVLFNREEDGLLGSSEFVASLDGFAETVVDEAHIFEMVGYCDRTPGSQRMPPRLPGIVAPNTGDFLALLANRHSNGIAENVLSLAASHVPEFPVLALKMYLGIEKYFGHFHRSDHAPFWKAGIPSVMWTDTSEFRNSHYHQASDTPDTLDYDFLSQVTRLALARAVSRARK
ncbi:M28 family peptidase [Zavarzinella formosa]|uniref:M28 family peptidase n=1 Tax=Zavarzinella formosa TaxID=360055 RepID=UPI0002E7D872|nr:M28 family peptidase [Zavarzinella formosa]